MTDSPSLSLLHSTPLPMLLLAATMSVAILAAGVLTVDAAAADRETPACRSTGMREAGRMADAGARPCFVGATARDTRHG
jgi:hypothetical protein